VSYAAVWLLVILVVHIRLQQPEETDEGILIDFGTAETGCGETDPAESDPAVEPVPPAAGQSPDDVLTQQTDPAPQVAPPGSNNRQAEQPPVERPRQPNRQALFPGRTPGSVSTAQGTAEGSGNQGTQEGDKGWSLDGRSLMGALPKPEYPVREEGRVIIEIHVDQQGTVTRAAFRSRGSTTTNAALVAAAERAAKQARFNVDETAPFPQTGTITYNFRIEQ
jgi:TonB family protein